VRELNYSESEVGVTFLFTVMFNLCTYTCPISIGSPWQWNIWTGFLGRKKRLFSLVSVPQLVIMRPNILPTGGQVKWCKAPHNHLCIVFIFVTSERTTVTDTGFHWRDEKLTLQSILIKFCTCLVNYFPYHSQFTFNFEAGGSSLCLQGWG
jgi:hypothetical protein